MFVCFLLCFMPRSASVHAYTLGFTFFHVYMLAFTFSYMLPCLYVFHMLACLDLCFHMLICLDLCFHMLACLDLCSICFMPSSMCLCTPRHVCMLRPRLCLSCYVPLKPFCHFIFLSCVLAYCFRPNLDPMVFVIVRTPQPTSKGLDHPFCMTMLACICALSLC